MKQQINFRASELTARQLEWLMERWGTSQTETLTVAIDRIYKEEHMGIQFYEITDQEPRDPEGRFSSNGGDYWFGRTVAVSDGVPVAVRFWTSAEFPYCPHGGHFGECGESCEAAPFDESYVTGWESGELMTGEKAERAARLLMAGNTYFLHFQPIAA